MSPSYRMSPASRAILDHLLKRGGRTDATLHAELVTNQAIMASVGLTDFTPEWLRKRLQQLHDLGWVSRSLRVGELHWAARKEVREAEARPPVARRQAKPDAPITVVPPARPSTMQAPAYRPAWENVRPGGSAFLAIPSRSGGDRQPYRGITSMASGVES